MPAVCLPEDVTSSLLVCLLRCSLRCLVTLDIVCGQLCEDSRNFLQILKQGRIYHMCRITTTIFLPVQPTPFPFHPEKERKHKVIWTAYL